MITIPFRLRFAARVITILCIVMIAVVTVVSLKNEDYKSSESSAMVYEIIMISTLIKLLTRWYKQNIHLTTSNICHPGVCVCVFVFI